jgi:hypothetical protein
MSTKKIFLLALTIALTNPNVALAMTANQACEASVKIEKLLEAVRWEGGKHWLASTYNGTLIIGSVEYAQFIRATLISLNAQSGFALPESRDGIIELLKQAGYEKSGTGDYRDREHWVKQKDWKDPCTNTGGGTIGNIHYSTQYAGWWIWILILLAFFALEVLSGLRFPVPVR